MTAAEDDPGVGGSTDNTVLQPRSPDEAEAHTARTGWDGGADQLSPGSAEG
jgi:hypothetical protein